MGFHLHLEQCHWVCRSACRIAAIDCYDVRKETILIDHESLFLDFIAHRGVGSKDVVASSPASYISYLNSVAKLIGRDITPALLRTETDVLDIARSIGGKRKQKTIQNYCTAMRQYAAMVEAKGL